MISQFAMMAAIAAAQIAPPKTATVTPPAATAPAQPYALRRIRLGITLDEFRAFPIIADQPHNDLQVKCSGDILPGIWTGAQFAEPSLQIEGVKQCQWFGQDLQGRMEWLSLDIGRGQGKPIFDFIDDGTGVERLMRIRIVENNNSELAIRDALTRGYGTPAERTISFQTKAGAAFPGLVSSWTNSLSNIMLEAPCIERDGFCLTYTHSALIKRYHAILERRDAAAAEKI